MATYLPTMFIHLKPECDVFDPAFITILCPQAALQVSSKHKPSSEKRKTCHRTGSDWHKTSTQDQAQSSGHARQTKRDWEVVRETLPGTWQIAELSGLLGISRLKKKLLVAPGLTTSNKKLLGTKGIATRSKDAANIAPGLTTSNKRTLLVTKGIATRSKDTTSRVLQLVVVRRKSVQPMVRTPRVKFTW